MDEKKNDIINASGWDAITEACENIYPTQKNPKHYGTLINWKFGGNDPLEGISIYDGGSFWHFVTYGLSELYETLIYSKGTFSLLFPSSFLF